MRTEEDLLGEKQVPDDAYYGIHTLRAMENFHISDRTINNYPEFIRGMVMIKKACALANKELGAIPSEVGDAIVKASNQILVDKKHMDQFPVDVFQGGAGTSVNMNTNEVLANIGLEIMGHKKGEYKYLNPNDHVNKGQSTNDAYPSGLRLAIYNSIMHILCPMEKLQKGFESKAAEFNDILKLGRTQLQDAVPMTLGQEFQAFANLLRDDRELIKKTAGLLLTVNLGGTAIGTGLNAPKGFSALVVRKLSDVTGYDCKLDGDLIKATSDTSDFIIVHACLKRLAVKMCKICNDLRLMSSGPRAGLKEINLPEIQAGSSIMPAKVNPVVPEVVNQACYKVIGNDTCVMLASENGQLQLNVMEPVIAQAMFESISLLSSSFRNLLDKCVSGITANKKRCEDYAMNNISLVTFLCPLIGHHNGDIIGKKCAQTGKSVREVALEDGYLSAAQIDEILNIQAIKKSVYPENAKPIGGGGAEGMRGGTGCTQSNCPKRHG